MLIGNIFEQVGDEEQYIVETTRGRVNSWKETEHVTPLSGLVYEDTLPSSR